MGFRKFTRLRDLFLILVLFAVSEEVNSGGLHDDRASLLSFKSAIVSDPQNALGNWSNDNNNSSGVHVCNWTGVTCNIGTRKTRVTHLSLSGLSLHGAISPAISNLSHLKLLDLSENFFRGQIPSELGSLVHLKVFSLSLNHLQGRIPLELASLHQLVYINLGSNSLVGEIPMPLLCNESSSSSLRYIDFSNNSLSGKIPLNEKCQLKELRDFLLWSNHFTGIVPKALSNSSKLEWLDLGSNSLSGFLPFEMIKKTPMLQFLYLPYNHFFKTDLEIFFTALINCSNLQELDLAGNGLFGELPSTIGELSKNLVQLHLDENKIYGEIPPSISNLFNLTLLNLSSNLLNGSIPPQICQMEKLERLYLSDNSLSGEIPYCFGDVPHLGLLDLSKNKLSGSIPDYFSNLPQLRRLLLFENQISGNIPPTLGKCLNLEVLDLSHNRISGMIPSEVARLVGLSIYLNLSRNELYGPMPAELSKMVMVLAIDLSSNKISGHIPSMLGGCIALEYLNLSHNVLQGSLPSLVAQIPYLKVLDLSMNRLMGEIPQSYLQASSTLKQLNLSFNNFTGNVSCEGAFSSLTVNSFLGNPRLCGSIQGMTSCNNKNKKDKKTGHLVILPIVLSVLVPSILCILLVRGLNKSKWRRQMSIFNNNNGDEEDEEEKLQEREGIKYPRISYQQLSEATGGFSSSSLIGSSRFGRVYRGVLNDNTSIAVKVLDSRTAGDISRSFKRECQVLKRTRHRNLIRIITICSRPDFKALVLPLMPNGSLENHLYPNNNNNNDNGLRRTLFGLDYLVQIVRICSDVAEGMAYLHHYSPVKVVHCDLKPSNILLDDDMKALVADFGIARLVKGNEESIIRSNDYSASSLSSTQGLLCGSVGYIAPEYGMGKRASTQGDVYSFGVLLLEMLTGKRPTDMLFHEGSSLHEWVKSHYPHKLEPIIILTPMDACNLEPKQREVWHNMVMELIELGLICTQYNPSTRPTMLDVAHELNRLKLFISCTPTQ